MKRPSTLHLCLVGILLATLPAEGKLTFCLRPALTELEGVAINQLVFKDGTVDVTYQPPRNWLPSSGAGNSLQFTIPAAEQASFSMGTGPRPGGASAPKAGGEGSATAEKDEVWEARLMSELPAAAQQVEVLENGVARVRIDGSTLRAVSASYSRYAQHYALTILYLVRQDEEVKFCLVSRLEDHPQLKEAMIRSLFSMEWHRQAVP